MKSRQAEAGKQQQQAASNSNNNNQGPRMLQRRDIDVADDLETAWRTSYLELQKLLTGATQQDNNILQAKVAESTERHTEIVLGLLFGILTNAAQAENYMRYLAFVVRDGFNLCVLELKRLILEKHHKILDLSRRQLFWLIQELVKLKVPDADTLIAALMRHVAGGDLTAKNIQLASSVLKLLTDQKAWLYGMPRLIPLAWVTFIRLIADHNKPGTAAIRQQEIAFCCSLWREKFEECKAIGRDAVRLLQDVNKLPELDALWRDIMTKPSVFAPEFTGLNELLGMKTPRKFLGTRLTPEMENQLLFILKNVKMGNQKRYQGWFMQKFFAAPESESLIPDLIRYICGVYHPPNHVLCSDIVPRWAIIGWLLKCVKTKYMAQSAKLALFYDWLFYDPKVDNIMNIEPAILLMIHSIPKYADITCSLIEFLVVTVESYHDAQKEFVRRGVHNSLNILLTKGVVSSILPIYNCPALDPSVRKRLQPLFRPFLKLEEEGGIVVEGQQQPPPQHQPPPQQPPAMGLPPQAQLPQQVPQHSQQIPPRAQQTPPPLQQAPPRTVDVPPVEAPSAVESEVEDEAGSIDSRLKRERPDAYEPSMGPAESSRAALVKPEPSGGSGIVKKIKDAQPPKIDFKPIKKPLPPSPTPSIDVPPSLVFVSRFLSEFVHALRANEPNSFETQANILQHLFSNLQKLSSINKYTPKTAPDLAAFLSNALQREFSDRVSSTAIFSTRPALHHSIFASYAACINKDKQLKPSETSRIFERNRVVGCLMDILAEFRLLEPSLGYRLMIWCLLNAAQGLNRPTQARRQSISKEDELGILGEMMKDEKDTEMVDKDKDKEKEKERSRSEPEEEGMLILEEGEESNVALALPTVGENNNNHNNGHYSESTDLDACYKYFLVLPHDVLLPYATFLMHLENHSATKQSQGGLSPLLADLQACARENADVFIKIVPYVFRYLPVEPIRFDLIHLIVSIADPTHMRSLVFKLMLGEFDMFGTHASGFIVKTLEWESLDQSFMWQLLTAEYSANQTSVKEELEVLVSRLVSIVDPDRHVEILTGLLFLLRNVNVKVSASLVKSVLASPFGRFSSCLLSYWAKKDPQTLSTLLSNEINRMDAKASDLENKLEREREREREREQGRGQKRRRESSGEGGSGDFSMTKGGPDRRYVECLLRNLEMWNRVGRLGTNNRALRVSATGVGGGGGAGGGSSEGGGGAGEDILNKPAIKHSLSRLMNSWGLKASQYEGLFGSGSGEWGGTRFGSLGSGDSGKAGGGLSDSSKSLRTSSPASASPSSSTSSSSSAGGGGEAGTDGPLKKRPKLRESSDGEDNAPSKGTKRKKGGEEEEEEEEEDRDRDRGSRSGSRTPSNSASEDNSNNKGGRRGSLDSSGRAALKSSDPQAEKIREEMMQILFSDDDNSDDEGGGGGGGGGNGSSPLSSPSPSPASSPSPNSMAHHQQQQHQPQHQQHHSQQHHHPYQQPQHHQQQQYQQQQQYSQHQQQQQQQQQYHRGGGPPPPPPQHRSPSSSPTFPHSSRRDHVLNSSAPSAFWSSPMKRDNIREKERDMRERERDGREREGNLRDSRDREWEQQQQQHRERERGMEFSGRERDSREQHARDPREQQQQQREREREREQDSREKERGGGYMPSKEELDQAQRKRKVKRIRLDEADHDEP